MIRIKFCCLWLISVMFLFLAADSNAQIFNPANGHTYLLTSQPLDIFAARSEATSMGGYLTCINDAAENSFVVSNFGGPVSPSGDTRLWIGASDEVVEGTWVWDSGEPFSYTNWIGGEPNDAGGIEDHALIQPFNAGLPGGWGDTDSVGLRWGVIEIPTTPSAPVFSYDSQLGATFLDLAWLPDGGIASSLSGTLLCSGATPGGLGVFGLSLAEVDFPLSFGIPLLIANDPVNFLQSGNFGFGFFGELVVPNVSRQHPFIAGSVVYIQFFEASPNIASSNGLGMLIEP